MGADKLVPSNMQQMKQRVSLVPSIALKFHNFSSYPSTATLRILYSFCARREANQTLSLRNQRIPFVAKMPEGVDISSITCLEDIKSCIASIEQEEVTTGCYGFVCSALIRIYEVLYYCYAFLHGKLAYLL